MSLNLPPLSVFSILASIAGVVLQSGEATSAIPILTTGALFSVCTTAVGYGVLKGKVDMHAANFADVNRKLDDALQRLSRIEGALGRGMSE